ncbi:MAG: hemerythrin domain-containing protein [Draconibacterium sp.]|nr:hemerythrin domain-containing protein [Draconibacterium sp.]
MKDFFTEFRNDHRQIRDLIMNLIRAFIQNDILKAEKLLFILNEIAGPHFQFEEEVLYPELIAVYGPEYINKLYIDHDLIIARV